MPCALVHASGTPSESNTSCTREQERWARHDQSNGVAESESFDNTARILVSAYTSIRYEKCLRWEERVERASTQMEVLHEHEQPRPLVPTCLSQTLHHTDGSVVANAVALHTRVS